MWILVPVIVLGVAAVAAVLPKHMHIFQLNSYRAAEQLKWLGVHRGAWVPQVIAAVFALGAIVLPVLCGIVLVLLFSLVVYLNRPQKKVAKKPLVYTPRVVRMFVTIAILVVVVIMILTFIPARFQILVATFPFILSPYLAVIADFVNIPIEYAIRQRYLKDARRMLASHPKLVKIGITGSFGKTSVKYYLTTVLRGRFNVLMTPESYNTPMGITKTIRSDLRATHEVFVCEMGAARAGEIKENCDLVSPTIGVITAIGEQHLSTFGTQDAILATKLELADAVKGKGLVYLNGDDAILRTNQPDQERWLYGLGTTNGTYAFDIEVSTTGTTFSLNHRGVIIAKIATPLIGKHNIQNLAGAAAVALDLGVTETELRTQMRKLEPAPHRLAMSRKNDVTIIDDAYNSNPAGAKAALDTLAMFEATKILITPGMVELGVRQEALNEEFGAQAAFCDYVYLIGAKQTEPIARGLIEAGYDPAKITVLNDVREAIAHAQALPTTGAKVILLENDLPDNY
ncbi:MAG: UDP-N-acetylmuramoyl-tripeptide--D-alanyl-D-alanine ligase [Propionibacteriaceae bacterium]|jgi:UDP-N-acetylmuramoyl-tripeptide--D-alanyl-D-alanine ligase|nr:UDP-N-acetylmuramoyl-tripeptide--D-alanyl-D-alanine ligase [Propionibacteriaceae bacterium]